MMMMTTTRVHDDDDGDINAMDLSALLSPTISMSETTVDEKKKQKNGQNDTSDFASFLKNYAFSLLVPIGLMIVVIGTMGLFTTKVAQANVLPDNIELAPFTAFDRVVESIPVDIHVIKTGTDTFSQKARFQSKEFLDSFQGNWMCTLKKYATPEQGVLGNTALYMSTLTDHLVAFNSWLVTGVFEQLSVLPESWIMLVYGLFGILVWIGMYVMNVAVSLFYHVSCIPCLFQYGDETNHWDGVGLFSVVKWLMFFIVWIPMGVCSAISMPFIMTVYALVLPLFATYKTATDAIPSGFATFLQDTVMYKKGFLFIMATLSLAYNSVTQLGTMSLIGVSIAVLVAYVMGMYGHDDIDMTQFSAGLRSTIGKASVEPIQSNSPKLVEICKQVPMKKTDARIKNGRRRELTKATEPTDAIQKQEDITQATIQEPTDIIQKQTDTIQEPTDTIQEQTDTIEKPISQTPMKRTIEDDLREVMKRIQAFNSQSTIKIEKTT